MEISPELPILLPANPSHQAAFPGALSRPLLPTHLTSFARARRRCLLGGFYLVCQFSSGPLRTSDLQRTSLEYIFRNLLVFNGKHRNRDFICRPEYVVLKLQLRFLNILTNCLICFCS